jgi:hypothetical protein
VSSVSEPKEILSMSGESRVDGEGGASDHVVRGVVMTESWRARTPAAVQAELAGKSSKRSRPRWGTISMILNDGRARAN